MPSSCITDCHFLVGFKVILVMLLSSSGYAAFVSMLIVDLYHNHPVLKVFVELMNQVRSRKETALEGKFLHTHAHACTNTPVYLISVLLK